MCVWFAANPFSDQMGTGAANSNFVQIGTFSNSNYFKPKTKHTQKKATE